MNEPDDFVSWHEWRPIIEVATTKAQENALIKAALGGAHVLRRDGMLIEANEHGRAYSCMDQGDMGVLLLRFRRKYGAAADGKLIDALKALAVIMSSTYAGGLRSRVQERSWFHGKTSRSSPALGYTLNKHLHACRSLADAANALVDIAGQSGGYEGTIEFYRAAAREGIRQLAGDTPRLDDFLAGSRSWLYYAIDGDGTGGRFNNGGKNGAYHLYCMRLMAAVNERCPGVDWTGVPRKELLAVYQVKVEDGGLYVDSVPSRGGSFEALPTTEQPLDADVVAFFQEA